MVTQLLQKQLAKELDLITENLPSFVQKFFTEWHYQILDDAYSGSAYMPTFTSDFLLVHHSYINELGYQEDEWVSIMYEDYNEWCKEEQIVYQ